VVALAGGVGAARFLRGYCEAFAPESLTAIVNTGDDRVFYGVHVSPDVDIVTYTLADQVNPAKGYGLRGDAHRVIEALERFGHATWFRLGDRDLATCLHRTQRLAAGAGLAEIADEVRRAFGVRARILPMSEAPCPTFVELSGGLRVHFEEYLVRDGAPADVVCTDLSAARAALPAPGVLDAIASAQAILICPSNPIASIAPILSLRGVREAIARAGAPVVAISPIVGGAPVKGPADHLLRAAGAEVSARGVAAYYGDLLGGFALDQRDAAQEAELRARGLRTRALDTLMKSREVAAEVARAALAIAAELSA
jgi:LPPG:FO 2-phospho-L-lactate transferase